MHVHQKPFLLRMLPTTLEERRNVLVMMMAVQRKSDPAIDKFGVSGWRVVILEHAGV
jgi:hypothetical protein